MTPFLTFFPAQRPAPIEDLVRRILEAIYRRSYRTPPDFSPFEKHIPPQATPCDWLETVGVSLIETERRQAMLALILAREGWSWE